MDNALSKVFLVLDLHISSMGEVGNHTKVLVCNVDSEGDADVDCGDEQKFDPPTSYENGPR